MKTFHLHCHHHHRPLIFMQKSSHTKKSFHFFTSGLWVCGKLSVELLWWRLLMTTFIFLSFLYHLFLSIWRLRKAEILREISEWFLRNFIQLSSKCEVFQEIQDSRRMAKNYCGCCEIAAFILSWHEYSNFNQQEQIFEFSFNDFNRIFPNFYTMVSTLHALLIFVYFISIWFLFYICWKPRFYQASEIENTKNFINFCFSYKICFLEWRYKTKQSEFNRMIFTVCENIEFGRNFFLISIQAKKWRRFPFFVVHKDF